MGRSRSTHPEDEKDFGEPIRYDPDFHGPLKGRSCTDIICMLLFFVFIACWIAVGIFAIKQGDPNSLLIPKDSSGKRCGHDSDLLGKKYLFFLDITKCFGPEVPFTGCKTRQVCVEKCPDSFFSYDLNKTTGIVYENLYCDYDIDPTDGNLDNYMKNGNCSRWYVPSEPVMGRCVPSILDIETLKEFLKSINQTISNIEKGSKNIKLFTQAEEAVVAITEDIITTWWQILIGLGASLVVCFIYIYLMRWVASYVVWFSLIGIVAILSYGVYATQDKYRTLLNKEKTQSRMIDTEKLVDNVLGEKNVWLAFLIILGILLAFVLLIIIFLRKRIVIAIALIKEGSKAVGACITSLFFPIIPWLLQIGVLAYAVTSGLYLASIGQAVYKVKGMDDGCTQCNYKDGDTCDPQKFYNDCHVTKSLYLDCRNATCSLEALQNPTHVRIFHAINVVGGFWGVFFASAFGEMVLAGTFATWYWTFKKTKVPFFTVTHSIYRTLRYHIGTLAFGSLIITICRLIRVAIEYIDHKLKKYDNAFVKGILCCCKCFFWCLENFLKFINRNSYIMCAIHGKNFCTSARDAFSLLMRNILRVFVLDKVTDLLFFLGKILITVCVATVSYTVFSSDKYIEKNNLHYELVPVILISIGAFFISNVFFSVYSMAVDTLFLCFLEDCERNDGSPEKPYYMSKQLMKILGKKNKKVK